MSIDSRKRKVLWRLKEVLFTAIGELLYIPNYYFANTSSIITGSLEAKH